jgi:lipopolysaccharide/colanic/teichoic acid biosynthesis glycosyltransferase
MSEFTRAANVAFSVAGLVVLSPVFFILAAAIVLDSAGLSFSGSPESVGTEDYSSC